MRRMIQVKGGLDEGHEFHVDNQISSCKYSQDGCNLAIGDESGRIVIFDVANSGELYYSSEFKAHRGGHDWANKKELKPSVISLDWLERNGSCMRLVSAGVKSIKFWKVHETSSKEIGIGANFIPSLAYSCAPSYCSSEIKELPTLHSTDIKSINLSANQEFLLSTDGKTVLKWNIEKSNHPHLISEAPIDPEITMEPERTSTTDSMDIESQSKTLKQHEAEELEEWNDVSYITGCKFHGSADNRLAYSTKTGAINYLDMRCTNSTRPSVVMEVPTPHQILRRYLNVISDFVFRPDGYSLVSRDYLSAKVWDMRKPSEPVIKHSIFPSINWKISELFDEMHYEDQFPMRLSPDGRSLLTGYLDCSFHEIDPEQNINHRYRVNEQNECAVERIQGAKRLDAFSADPRVSCIDYCPDGESLCATIRDSIFVFGTDRSHQQF